MFWEFRSHSATWSVAWMISSYVQSIYINSESLFINRRRSLFFRLHWTLHTPSREKLKHAHRPPRRPNTHPTGLETKALPSDSQCATSIDGVVHSLHGTNERTTATTTSHRLRLSFPNTDTHIQSLTSMQQTPILTRAQSTTRRRPNTHSDLMGSIGCSQST